jgi:hypothetical protein
MRRTAELPDGDRKIKEDNVSRLTAPPIKVTEFDLRALERAGGRDTDIYRREAE